MNYYSISRLSRLDVRWAGIHKGAIPNPMYNPNYELLVVTEGPYSLKVGDERLTLSSGDGLLLMPWEQHCTWGQPDSRGSIMWAQFDCDPAPAPFETWTEWTDSLNLLHPGRNQLRTYYGENTEQLIIPRRFQSDRRYELFSLFEKMVHEFEHPAELFRFRLTLLLGQMLELLTSGLLRQTNTGSPLPASYLTYRKLIIYLELYYQKPFSKTDIEAHLDRKYEYLSSVFKAYAGITVTEYIQRLRLQRAKHLLERTTAPIAEIAEAVGFRDPLYFSRLFKKLEQLSPTEYRNRAGEQA